MKEFEQEGIRWQMAKAHVVLVLFYLVSKQDACWSSPSSTMATSPGSSAARHKAFKYF